MRDDQLTLPESWKPVEGGFQVDPRAEWLEDDEVMLDSLLAIAAHDLDHDIIDCMLSQPPDVIQALGRFEWVTVRENEDVTVAELADRLGVTKGTISRWESGKRRPASPSAYTAWLRECDQRQIGERMLDVWKMILRRDGWSKDLDALFRYGAPDLWNVVWKENGLFDKWCETGTLPHFTPADAGVAV
ncbi:MAG: helix-turn-helix domain-containing protein [Acidimicrobiia bacterium]